MSDGPMPFRPRSNAHAACSPTRELRNAVWEIYDLIRDWQQATKRTAERVDSFAVRLERPLDSADAGAGAG